MFTGYYGYNSSISATEQSITVKIYDLETNEKLVDTVVKGKKAPETISVNRDVVMAAPKVKKVLTRYFK